MSPRFLLDHFDLLAEAPGGVARLRELVLRLAVRGKLVPQDPTDEPASELLKRIASARARLVKEGKIRAGKTLPPVGADEAPFEVPEGWVWCRLGDIANVVYGKNLPTTLLLDRGFDVFGANGIIGKYSSCLYEDPQLLISCRGAYSGKPNLSPPNCFVTNNSLVCEFYADSIMDKRFLYRQLQAVDRSSMVSGSAQPQVTVANANPQLVAIPPLAEQHRIVARVDELMALLDRLEAAREERDTTRLAARDSALAALRDAADASEVTAAWRCLEARMDDLFQAPEDVTPLRQAILQLAVRGELVAQDPADEPASVLLKRIASERARLVKEGKIRAGKPLPPVGDDEAPFEVPEGWVWCRLGDLCTLENGDRGKNYPGKTALVESGVPFINAGHLHDGRVRLEEMNYIPPKRFALLRSGKVAENDILYCLRGSLGKVALVHGIAQGAIASSLAILRAIGEIEPSYLLRYFFSPIAFTMVKKYDNGSAQPNLSGADLCKFIVPLPPLAEQHRIVARVDQLNALCDRLESRLAAAREAQTALAAAAVHHIAQPDFAA